MTRTGLALLVIALGPTSAFADDYPDPFGRACLDDDDVVGYRTCPRYAPWGLGLEHPYMFVDIGVNIRQLPRRAVPSGRIPASAAARATSSPLPTDAGTDLSLTFQERINIAVSRVMYLGFELELGDLGLSTSSEPGGRQVVVGGLGVAGLHGDIRLGVVGIELLAGGRMVDTELETEWVSDGEAVLEARVRADLWLGPWFTVGGSLGKSLLDGREWMAGLYLGVHTRSFGAHR